MASKKKTTKVKARNTIGMSDESAANSGKAIGQRVSQKGKEARARASTKTTVHNPKKKKTNPDTRYQNYQTWKELKNSGK